MGIKLGITGSSSTMAKLLIDKLLDQKKIELIKGLDISPTNIDNPKFTFVKGDVTNKDSLNHFMGSIDILIHMAFIVFQYPKNDEHLEYIRKVNIEGSKNVFKSATNNGINKIIYISSVASYGFHYDKDPIENHLKEDDDLTGDTNNVFYFRHKQAVENYLDQLQHKLPNLVVTRLRPHVLVGPEYMKLVNLKPFKDGLQGSTYTRIKQPKYNGPPLEQLVHEEDVIKAIIYSIDNDLDGPLNVAGDPVNLEKYLDDKSIKLIEVPLSIARFFLWFKALFSDTGKLERYWTKSMVHPVIVDNSRYKQLIGKPKSTREILNSIYNSVN